MVDFVGKRALVTGAASGIGLGIAKKLQELGASVYIIDCNKENLAKAVSESGDQLIPLHCDIAHWSSVREMVKNVLPIQLLVNNAGIAILNSVLEVPEDEIEKTLNVNLKAAINLT